MSVTIKLRRGISSDWLSQNIVLASGEPGYEIDTGRLKIGNGTTQWGSLQYASVIPSGFIAGTGVAVNLGTNGSTATISVSGLINNPTNNRILTSRDSTTTGIDAESNLTFDGTTLNVTGDVSANYYFGNFDGPIVYDCRNNTASTINKGTPVYISGHFANGKVDIEPADASNSAKMPALGLLGETLTTGQEGHVYIFGALSNVDTQTPGYTVGQTLYVSPTGGLTTTRPTASNHLIQNIARVARVSDTNGRLLVLGPARTNDIPNSGNFASLTVNSTGVSVIGHTHTSSDITNFNTSVSGLLPTISNSGDNRILTSTGTSTGVNAESNATFDGTTLFIPNLDVSVSGDIDTLKINKFFHNNLAVASGLGNNDLLIAIINPTGTATTEVIQGSVLRSSLLNQPAQLQFRQGTDAERLLITPASGEPIWTTDSQKFYIGDGTTVGGDFVGPSPYDRGVGTNSVVVSNSGCEAIGSNSVVLGGINNLAIGVRSFIGGGSNNVAASKARIANNLESSTNTITVLNATAAEFDNTTANALRIVYFSGTSRLVTSRTVSSATQSGANVTLVLASNVGATSPNGWYYVVVVNTAETDNSIGQVVNGGDSNFCSGSNSIVGGGFRNTSSATYSTVGGGAGNTSSGIGSTVGGGIYNTNSGGQSTVGGGKLNTSNSYHSTVSGGYNNTSSGYGSTIGGGRYNQSGGISSVVSGGGWYNPITEITEGNTASADISTVGGGAANSATAMGSVVSGGFSNTSSNIYTSIGGGKSNTCSGAIASVGGGTINNASGQNSVISGGSTNTASGQNSVIGGGSTNTASASASTVGGGNLNSVTALVSTVPGGFRAKATRYGELSHAAGYFAVVGDAQHTVLIARKTTTDATANQVLFLDNSSARLTLPAETTWTFSVKLSAYNDTDNQGGWWIFRGGIRRNAASGTALIGSLITESGFESSFNTASTSVVADDTNEALEIRVTGVASKNIRWVAVVDISQVSYGTP